MLANIPPVYLPPFGGPLRWQDEVSGLLPTAVKAYLNNRIDGTPMTPDELEMVRRYCEYYINAPCWATEGFQDKFVTLREWIKNIKTASELSDWFWACLDVGVDPL